jgi:hypothetical protein
MFTFVEVDAAPENETSAFAPHFTFQKVGDSTTSHVSL